MKRKVVKTRKSKFIHKRKTISRSIVNKIGIKIGSSRLPGGVSGSSTGSGGGSTTVVVQAPAPVAPAPPSSGGISDTDGVDRILHALDAKQFYYTMDPASRRDTQRSSSQTEYSTVPDINEVARRAALLVPPGRDGRDGMSVDGQPGPPGPSGPAGRDAGPHIILHSTTAAGPRENSLPDPPPVVPPTAEASNNPFVNPPRQRPPAIDTVPSPPQEQQLPPLPDSPMPPPTPPPAPPTGPPTNSNKGNSTVSAQKATLRGLKLRFKAKGDRVALQMIDALEREMKAGYVTAATGQQRVNDLMARQREYEQQGAGGNDTYQGVRAVARDRFAREQVATKQKRSKALLVARTRPSANGQSLSLIPVGA